MRHWPIRLHIAAWTAMVVACALALFGAGTAWHVRAEQIEDFDRQLETEARALMSAWREAKRDTEDLEEFVARLSGMRGRVLEVTAEDGRQVFRSANLEGGQPFASLPSSAGHLTVRRTGRRLRVFILKKDGTTLALGGDLHPIDDAVHELIRAFFFALPLVLLALTLGCWWIARKALRPIEMITRDAEKITARHLDQRLPVVRAGDEIGRLALVLNRMIERLDASFLEVAQFTSDAAHELRTPLTVMRGEIEAEARSGAYTPEQEKFLLSLLGDTAHLSTIVGNLLLLSRADAGRLDLQFSEVDPGVLLRDVVADAEILAAPGRIAVHADVPAGLSVRADPARLRQVLLNLFDNAIKYNRDGGEVHVRLFKIGDTVCLSIANTGPGIAAERAAHIFQRFYRGDPAHSTAVEGQGLGLSICRELIHAHGGRIELAENRPGHVEFRVYLPARAG